MVTEDELEELIKDCPVLYHMAERGSWESIREYGLLSTSALLDAYGITGEQRHKIEAERRNSSVPIEAPGLPRAVIRDQLPMTDDGLRRCLPPDVTPSDWYRLLNAKVFFWLTAERLHTLLRAGTYLNSEHDVLEVSTRTLVEAHRDEVWLCPINSGATRPFPHPRDLSTFSRISDYPYQKWRSKRQPGERVVELAVDYGVPDVIRFVRSVTVMKASQRLDTLYVAP